MNTQDEGRDINSPLNKDSSLGFGTLSSILVTGGKKEQGKQNTERATTRTSSITSLSSSMNNNKDNQNASTMPEASPPLKKKLRFNDSVFIAEERLPSATTNHSITPTSAATTVVAPLGSENHRNASYSLQPIVTDQGTSRNYHSRKMKHHGHNRYSSSSARKKSSKYTRRSRSHHPYSSSSSFSERGGSDGPRLRSSSSSSKFSSRGIPLSDINESDVLCEGAGRGVMVDANNPGNQRFQALLKLKSNSFRSSSKREKLKMAHLAATLVHESIPRGRFLIMNPDSGLWHEIKEDKAWSKVLRSFILHKSSSSSKKIKVDYDCMTSTTTKTSTRPSTSISTTNTRSGDTISFPPAAYNSDMIHINDVLCGGPGQGILSTNNPGNLRFQTLVDSKLAAFCAASKQEKLNMAHLASLLVHEAIPRGRFLVLADTGNWHEVPKEKAWSKVLRTFFARLPQEEGGAAHEEAIYAGISHVSSYGRKSDHHSSSSSRRLSKSSPPPSSRSLSISNNYFDDKHSFDFHNVINETSPSFLVLDQDGEQRVLHQQELSTTTS